VPTEEAWQILADQLYFTALSFGLIVHAFVVMPNHFHLLVSNPHGNLSPAMAWFMRETAREMNRRSGFFNQLWGSRFFRSEIRTKHYYRLAYKYIYRNPVKAKLTTNCQDYEFSTLGSKIGRFSAIVPVVDEMLMSDVEGVLRWINEAPKATDEESVRRALRHSIFQLPKLKRAPNPLEHELM